MRAAAVPLAIAVAAAGCGESDAEQSRFLVTQKCAPCHATVPGRDSPVAAAPNLADRSLTVERVRRAIIDGRRGMPAGLLGGSDVDQVAAFLAGGGR